MGESGDLLLIFADALVRSWKQITKFKPSGAAPARAASPPAPPARAKAIELTNGSGGGAGFELGASVIAQATAADFSLEGLIRDERGVRMAPESDD
jgi:cyanophycin synthetase